MMTHLPKMMKFMISPQDLKANTDYKFYEDKNKVPSFIMNMEKNAPLSMTYIQKKAQGKALAYNTMKAKE